MLKKFLWLVGIFLVCSLFVWAATNDFISDADITVTGVTFNGGTTDMIVFSGSQAESWAFNTGLGGGTLTVTNPNSDAFFRVGSGNGAVETLRVTQGGSTVACAINTTAGTSYVTVPTNSATYTLVPSTTTDCQDICSSVDNASTLNDYPTCGAATCEQGYHLSGIDSTAVCVVDSSGGGGSINPPDDDEPIPTCSLSANPTSLTSGDSSLLTWSTTEATTAVLNQNIGPVSIQGTRSVLPLITTVYTLTVSGQSGSMVSCQTTIVVSSPPVEPPVVPPEPETPDPDPEPETPLDDGSDNEPGPEEDMVGGISSSTPTLPLPEFVTTSTTPVLNNFIPVIAKKVISPTLLGLGLLAGLIQATVASTQLLSLFDLYLLIWRGIAALLGLLGLRKKYQPWGTVYDSITKQPIDPAYVSILNLESGSAGPEGKKVASAITDLDGRFGFLLTVAGAYAMRADKSHYRFPSQVLQGKSQDELYGNLYFGEAFSMQPGQIVTRNIPLDPVSFDWNEFAKNKQHFLQLYSRRELWQARIFSLFFGLGLITAMLSGLFNPTWLNGLILLIYLFIYTFKWWWRAKHKPGVAKIGDEPLSFGVIRAYVPGLNQEVRRVVADMFGRFYLLLRPGTYYLTFEEKLPNGSYRLVHKTEPLKLKTGLFDKEVFIV